jgi:hypothetical protein
MVNTSFSTRMISPTSRSPVVVVTTSAWAAATAAVPRNSSMEKTVMRPGLVSMGRLPLPALVWA